jgi:hypothetical protein
MLAEPPPHEHIVRINDATIPTQAWLTREQLWLGLAATMRQPHRHDGTIDEFTVTARTTETLELRILPGPATFLQTLTGHPPDTLSLSSQEQSTGERGMLDIRIEEPALGALFVRFVFELPESASDDSVEEGNARRAAYDAYARDIVRAARTLARAVGLRSS